MKYDILIVEDEIDIREIISGILDDEGHNTRQAATSDEALVSIQKRQPSLVVLDVWLKGSSMDGIELLDKLKENYPNMPVIVISGHGSRLRQENEELKGRSLTDTDLIGTSALIQQLRLKISRVATTNSRVLITGPSGSGKELIARLLHGHSKRSTGPFKAVNAASFILMKSQTCLLKHKESFCVY